MNARRKHFDAIEKRAADWLSRRDAGMNDAERAEFDRWLASDPRHAAAVDEIDGVWAAFDRLSLTERPQTVRRRMSALRRREQGRWLAAGAVMLVAACMVLFFSLRRPPEPTHVLTDTVATARVSEPARQTLPDGSIVEFKEGAAISVAFDQDARRVILTSGEAHFAVTKNPRRPFIVESGAVKVRAVGTAFAVHVGGTEVDVLVTEGKVDVTSRPAVSDPASDVTRDDAAPTLVSAGQQATVVLGAQSASPVVTSLAEAEMVARLSWRVPALEFSETSVAEAVALFNRYGKPRLRAVDNAVAALRVTGVFRSDNPEGFARALEASLGLRVEYRRNEILLRSP